MLQLEWMSNNIPPRLPQYRRMLALRWKSLLGHLWPKTNELACCSGWMTRRLCQVIKSSQNILFGSRILSQNATPIAPIIFGAWMVYYGVPFLPGSCKPKPWSSGRGTSASKLCSGASRGLELANETCNMVSCNLESCNWQRTDIDIDQFGWFLNLLSHLRLIKLAAR